MLRRATARVSLNQREQAAVAIVVFIFLTGCVFRYFV